MRKNVSLLIAVGFFVILLIQGCDVAFTIPSPIIVAVKATVIVATQIVNGTIEPPPNTPTPPVADPNGVFVMLSVDYQPPDPVHLKSGQKLYAFSPAGWGEFGWNLTFDHSFFQLDSQNAPKGLSQGWWIWIPLKAGKSSIEIAEVPWPCLNSNYP